MTSNRSAWLSSGETAPNGWVAASFAFGAVTLLVLVCLLIAAYAFGGEGGEDRVVVMYTVAAICAVPVSLFALAIYGYRRRWPSLLIVVLNLAAFGGSLLLLR